MIDRFILDRVGQLSLPFSNFLRPACFSTSSSHFAKKRMPPKKAPVQEKRTLLGRPGNNLKVGIVGLFPEFSVAFFASYRSQVYQMLGNLPFSMSCQKRVMGVFVPAGVRAHMCYSRLGQGRQLPLCNDKP